MWTYLIDREGFISYTGIGSFGACRIEDNTVIADYVKDKWFEVEFDEKENRWYIKDQGDGWQDWYSIDAAEMKFFNVPVETRPAKGLDEIFVPLKTLTVGDYVITKDNYKAVLDHIKSYFEG